MYKEVLARTHNGGAIVGHTTMGLCSTWGQQYISPEKYDKADKHLRDSDSALLIRIG